MGMRLDEICVWPRRTSIPSLAPPTDLYPILHFLEVGPDERLHCPRCLLGVLHCALRASDVSLDALHQLAHCSSAASERCTRNVGSLSNGVDIVACMSSVQARKAHHLERAGDARECTM